MDLTLSVACLLLAAGTVVGYVVREATAAKEREDFGRRRYQTGFDEGEKVGHRRGVASCEDRMADVYDAGMERAKRAMADHLTRERLLRDRRERRGPVLVAKDGAITDAGRFALKRLAQEVDA